MKSQSLRILWSLAIVSALFLQIFADHSISGSEEGEEEQPFVGEAGSSSKNKLASCDVFDPFKVLPSEEGHYQIGGAFPLHSKDCLTLVPSSVQDVVAIQWALAHWNDQTPRGERSADEDKLIKRPKLGLFAGDSCSRHKEAISQTLRFVDSVGYHEPSECLQPNKALKRISDLPKMIGLLMPKDRESAESVAQVLRPSTMPIGAFSSASAQPLADANVRRFITTAPLISDYARTLIELMKMLGSDLVSIVDYGEDYAYTPLLQEQLRLEGISVAEIVAVDHPMLPAILSSSDAKIIVSLVPHRVLRDAQIGELGALREMPKLWIGMELEMDAETFDGEGMLNFLPKDRESQQGVKLQFMTIRRRRRALPEFSSYFLRVLLSNHAQYTLLRAYAQQVYGCEELEKGKNCSSELLTPERLAKLHRLSNTVEPAVLLTYGLARAAEKLQANHDEKCSQQPFSVECHDSIRVALLSISPNDRTSARVPPGFAQRLAEMRFFATPEGIIQLAGIAIEVILEEKEGRDGANIYRFLIARISDWPSTGAEWLFWNNREIRFTPKNTPIPIQMPTIQVTVQIFIPPFCGDHCESATRRPNDQTFLSVPQQYSLFIAAIFNLRGPNCGQNVASKSRGDAITLPLAFVHAMAAFRRNHSPKSSLFNSGGIMDIGALLVDTCSNGRDQMEFLVDSERNCYKFTQAERNWTIAAGATIGYIVGDDHPAQDAIIQAMFGQPGSAPVVGVRTSQSPGADGSPKSPLLGQGPSHRTTAIALAQFLRRMHWQYVNVVLDRKDAASVSLFKQFERLASPAGICTADLAIVGDDQSRSEEGEEQEDEEESGQKAKRGPTAQQTKATEDEQRRRFTGVGPPNANVTLVFASAKQAADYMSAHLREELMASPSGGIPIVHVMLGDAHNFYLHDPTNLAQYAGTVSFQAKDVTTDEFRDWLQTLTPLSLPEAWFWRHVEDIWHCSLFRNSFARFNGRMCTGEERLDVKGMGRLGKAGYLARGVERMLDAIDKAHKKLCPSEKLCDEFLQNGRRVIREFLQKTPNKDADDVFEIYELIPTDHHGNFDYTLIANMSVSSRAPPKSGTPNNRSPPDTVHFLADYRPFAYGGVPISRDSPSATVMSRCRAPYCKCAPMGSGEFMLDEDANELFGRSYIRREPIREGMADLDQQLLEGNADDPEVREFGPDDAIDRDVDWAIRLLLLSLSGLLTFIASFTLLCILIKIWRRTIRGSQSLGILLLIGIIAMHASAFLFTAENGASIDPLICHLRIALPALAHALCFGVIIVKAIQLRNSEVLASLGGVGQQITYWNYWLLLFFIVVVQVVICFRWLLLGTVWPSSLATSSSDQFPSSSSFFPRCSFSSSLFLLAQIYTFFLLFLALLLSAQNRTIKRNYKEAKWLFITSLVCSLILTSWAVFHAFMSTHHMAYLTVLELHLTGAILLAFVFGPKLYVLLFYEPVVVQYDGNGAKAMDLFEADWRPEAVHGGERNSLSSPTLSSGSSNKKSKNNDNNATSRMNSGSQSSVRGARIGGGTGTAEDEDDERVTSAFQTVMRKKTSIGSNNGANKVQRTASASAAAGGAKGKDAFCASPNPGSISRGKEPKA